MAQDAITSSTTTDRTDDAGTDTTGMATEARMNLTPRIDSIKDTLYEEYFTALEDDLEMFERLMARIETALRTYRKRQEAV